MFQSLRFRLAVVLGANVCFGAGLFFHAFLYNFYLDALGLRESMLGLAAAALTAGGLAALLPAGALVDRLGPRLTFHLAVVATSVGLALGALAEHPLAIGTSAALAGFGTVSWRVAQGPILMQITTPGTRPRVFSWNVALLVGSGAAWIALAGRASGDLEAGLGLSRVAATRAVLLAGAAATAVATPMFAWAWRPWGSFPGQPGVARVGRSLAQLVGAVRLAPRLGGLVSCVALWMLGPALVLPFFNLYFLREHRLSVEHIGLLFGTAHAVTALVILGSGELAARVGPTRLLAGWTLLFAPALWALAGTRGLGLAFSLYFLQGIISPATNALIDPVLLEAAPADQRGAVSGWRNAATEFGGIAGASLGGAVLEARSFSGLFVTAGVVGLVGALSLLAGLRRLR